MSLQYGRQVRMLGQRAGLDGFELSGAAIEYGIDVATRQTRDMHQSVDIGMPGMDRSCESAPRRVISGVNRVARCADPCAAVTSKVEQRQHFAGSR